MSGTRHRFSQIGLVLVAAAASVCCGYKSRKCHGTPRMITGVGTTYVRLTEIREDASGHLLPSSGNRALGSFVLSHKDGRVTFDEEIYPRFGLVDGDGNSYALNSSGLLYLTSVGGVSSYLGGWQNTDDDLTLLGGYLDSKGGSVLFFVLREGSRQDWVERRLLSGALIGRLPLLGESGVGDYQFHGLTIQDANTVWAKLKKLKGREFEWITRKGEFDEGLWTAQVDGEFEVIDEEGNLLESSHEYSGLREGIRTRTMMARDGRRKKLAWSGKSELNVLFGGRYGWYWDEAQLRPVVVEVVWE